MRSLLGNKQFCAIFKGSLSESLLEIMMWRTWCHTSASDWNTSVHKLLSWPLCFKCWETQQSCSHRKTIEPCLINSEKNRANLWNIIIKLFTHVRIRPVVFFSLQKQDWVTCKALVRVPCYCGSWWGCLPHRHGNGSSDIVSKVCLEITATKVESLRTSNDMIRQKHWNPVV